MPRVFISYKRADKDKVFPLKDKIEAAIGEPCWIDLDGIESDAQFVNVIINRINDAKIVLFMYTNEHFKIVDYNNDWTLRELAYAQKKGKRIIIINIDNAPLSDWFMFMYGNKQYVDMLSYGAIDKLSEEISSWLGDRRQKPQTKVESNSQDESNKKLSVESLHTDSIKTYDIFISYRRKDNTGNVAGRDIARGLKHYLEFKGYSCFFDYSECDDGEFENIIIPAVKKSRYFLLVMTNGALDRCVEEGDWVRKELNEAINSHLKIIPIAIIDNEHPEISFQGNSLSLPYPLNIIEKIQWSEVSMGSLYEISVDRMIEKRLTSTSKDKF